MNKVSIIMPSYNAAKFIAASIQSVIGQTYRNWELLITDDCSKDDTVKIVEKFIVEDNRIKLFSTGKNSGPACARNKSLDSSPVRANKTTFQPSRGNLLSPLPRPRTFTLYTLTFFT